MKNGVKTSDSFILSSFYRPSMHKPIRQERRRCASRVAQQEGGWLRGRPRSRRSGYHPKPHGVEDSPVNLPACGWLGQRLGKYAGRVWQGGAGGTHSNGGTWRGRSKRRHGANAGRCCCSAYIGGVRCLPTAECVAAAPREYRRACRSMPPPPPRGLLPRRSAQGCFAIVV